MTKKIMICLIGFITCAAMVSCKEEGTKTKNSDGFNEINVIPVEVHTIEYNDGWGNTETENVITERILTEAVITEETIVETTIVHALP